jgi:hypothetical protein
MNTIGLLRTDRHDYYWNDGETTVGPMPGVTGVLRIIDKPAIATWAKTETAKCAIRNWDMLEKMISTGGSDAAVAWLSRIPDYQKDTAGKLGSAVHRLAEMASREQDIVTTPEELPFIEAYRRFLSDYNPKLVSLEKGIINLRLGYGGTYDLLLRLDGELWLVDLKTSKGAYAETALQLAAYGNAEFIGLPNDPKPYPMPHIDRYAVLHLRPDAYPEGYRLIEFRVGQPEWRAFQAALELSRWSRTAKPVGEPVARSFVNKRVPKVKAAA